MSRRSNALVAVAVVTAVVGLGLMGGALWSGVSGTKAPPPAVAPTWHPAEATPVPSSAVPESNVVVPASAPVRLQIPTLQFPNHTTFDSSTLAGTGKLNPIQEWTQAMNDAYNGDVTPPKPWKSSLVWDSTVAGGGLFGTDAQSSGRILAHTTPENWSEIGPFTYLKRVHIGDLVIITTANGGRLCYNVTKLDDSIRKDMLNVVYDKKAVIKGVVYLITCYRPDGQNTGPTTNNLVVTLRLNQQLTNAGSC